MRKELRRMLPVVVYVVLIFVVSSIPKLAPPGPEFLFRDKALHLVEYFVLGVLLFWGFGWEVSASRLATFGFLLAAASIIGALNEILQSYIPGREMSIGDWLADLAGSGAGIAVFVFTRLGTLAPSPIGEKRG